MKVRLAILILCLGVTPLFGENTTVGKVEYGTYVNARFQFEVKYPKNLVSPDSPSDNNDGRNFFSKDKQFHVMASAQYNSAEFTWKEEFQNGLDNYKDAKVIYKAFKKNYFVISGYKAGEIFYYKEILVDMDGMDGFLRLEIDYPRTDKDAWNDIVKTCAGSLKLTKASGLTDDVFK